LCFAHPAPSTRSLRAFLRWLRPALLGLVLGMASIAQALDDARLLRSAALARPRAEAAMRQLQPLLEASRRADSVDVLKKINLFFNRRIEFAADQQAWGKADYWASPLEVLNKGQGDCEDYAIAKYFSLLAAGVPVARLRLVYMRAQLDGNVMAHMVLAYYPTQGGAPLILDNLVDEILPATLRADLSPVFSFNSQGLWHGVGMVGAGDPAARLSRWHEVMAKARAEGFP
jgi:predicted transglutaminase-like cysteine proteinase